MGNSYELKNGEYIDDKSIIHSKNNGYKSVYEELENKVDSKILWSNPSPNSEFSAKKISIDLSKYTFYEIIWQQWTSSNLYYSTGKIPVGSKTSLVFVENTSTIRVRSVTESDNTGITFGIYNNNGYVNVPRYIIGYKY